MAIVPVLPNGDVLLVRQYRHAVRSNLWEIPAGKLEPGEDTLACAQRELREETGYVAERWVELMSFFTTPGFSDERITLFCAEGLTARSRLDDGEITALLPASPEAVLEMIAAGAIVDAKTILAMAWLHGGPR